MSLILKPVNQFLDELSSSSPAPGGGSVSALAGSLGTALISMVCHLTIGKKKYAGVESEMEEVLAKSEKLSGALTSLIDEDTDAFNVVMKAFGMPKDSETDKVKRAEAIEEATKNATAVPLKVMRLCGEAIRLSDEIARKGNSNAISDAGVSSLMIQSACRGAYYNVKINLSSLKDQNFVSGVHSEASSLLARVDSMAKDVQARVESSWP